MHLKPAIPNYSIYALFATMVIMEKRNDNSNSLLESAVAEKLKLSYEDRIESHENARKLVFDLQNAGENLRAKSEKAS